MIPRSTPAPLPTSRRASRGFTLIELMVAASIAMLLLAGAFEMHAAFNRQNIRQQEVADMQQSLRVAMQVIGRSVRDAGTGLSGGTAQLYNTGVLAPQPCVATGSPPGAPSPVPSPLALNHTCMWAVQYSNSNVYAHPKIAFDSTAVDNDQDEDWLRIVSFDGASVVRVVPTDLVNNKPLTNGTIAVSDTRNFAVGSYFLIGNSYPVSVNATGQPTLGWRSSCIRQATAVVPPGNPAGLLATPGTVSFAPNASNPPLGDACMTSVFPGLAVPSSFTVAGQSAVTYVYPIDRSVVFRVEPAVAGPPLTPPRLRAWYSAPGAPSFLPNVAPLAQGWQTLTENIEHMQVALVMSDGTVCGNALNSVDNPGPCNPQAARAVRITLVARSSSPYGSVVGGVYSGWMSQGTGGQWEDFAQPAQQDGYLRRTLTSEFQIRNVPWGRQ